jgi:hypothetical protein
LNVCQIGVIKPWGQKNNFIILIVGENALSNRFRELNGQIDIDHLNLNLIKYKTESKKLHWTQIP